MDISMDIHEKSVDMDMDMDVIFHIHGNPDKCSIFAIVEIVTRRNTSMCTATQAILRSLNGPEMYTVVQEKRDKFRGV